MGVFLDTTQVAIKEMIEEFGNESRFGRILSEEDLAQAATRIAEFFEMTLNLRARLNPTNSSTNGTSSTQAKPQATFQPNLRASDESRNTQTQIQHKSKDPFASSAAPFVRSKNASEMYLNLEESKALQQFASVADTKASPNDDLKLPRKRVMFSAAEREKMPNAKRQVG